MKAALEHSDQNKILEPFKVELTIETIEEARLLFHVMNMSNLRTLILESDYWKEYTRMHSEDFSKDFDIDLYKSILKEIEDQGFSL